MPFADLIGHGPVVTLLRQAVRRGRVPQSLLFAGPEGVGKRAVALALAQAVNCPNAKDGDACGRCATCTRIARGQHSDVVFVEKGDEASIKIKQLRERILDVVGYRPFEAKRRVYLVDPADEMTLEAQDALLKTLEEPPPAAILVLVTAYPDTLLPTIQSRCRRLRFGVLSDADVVRVLVERTGAEPAAARALAAAAGGRVSRALAERDGYFEDDRDAALALVTAGRAPSIGPRLKAAAALAQHGSGRRDREALGERLAIVASLLRDLAAAALDVPLTNADVADALRQLVPAYPVARIADAFGAVTRAEQALERNGSPKIIADWLAVTL